LIASATGCTKQGLRYEMVNDMEELRNGRHFNLRERESVIKRKGIMMKSTS
jgi:hypothetical protein